MEIDELIRAAIQFHNERTPTSKQAWSSEGVSLLLRGVAWGEDIRVVDVSDYNYDFCDSFDFLYRGAVLVSVDVSHVTPAFRLTGWAVRKNRQKTATDSLVVAEGILGRLRDILTKAGYREITRTEQAIKVAGVSLELSEPENATLGKCLFKDYDGPAEKGSLHATSHDS